MNAQQRINQAQADLVAAQTEQRNCQHNFSEGKYDPETVREGYGGKYVGHGSDPSWEYDGYRDVTKDRWSRECTKCGKKEYTYIKEPIIKEYKPQFNG